MRVLFNLAWRSLRNRPVTSILTVLAVALSITLLLGVEQARRGMRESFTGTIKGTDLVVGARGGTLQLLLGAVFGIGSPTGSVPYGVYEQWAKHPAIRWTVPLAIGDSHRGYRVIGTTPGLFEHWRYRSAGTLTFAEGKVIATARDVVLGSDVAEKLRYALGSEITVGHGLNAVAGLGDHESHPFVVVGILKQTFTPLDRALFVTLDGIEAMHGDEGAGPGGAPTMPGAEAPPVMPGASPPTAMPGASAPSVMPGASGPAYTPPSNIFQDQPKALSAFLVGTKTRFETLRLQREINQFKAEPLTAVIPGVTLAELWRTLGTVEGGLRLVGALTIIVGLIGMLVSLYSSLEARRREMAVLRAVGARPGMIVSLLVLESGLLTLLGCVLGVGMTMGGFAIAQGVIESRTGVHIAVQAPGTLEWLYIGVVLSAGVLVGLVPAWRAYRSSLADGLSPRL
ncbi:MAG: ABC transporter permease [Gemmatimonadaceae bacterium]|nr:ABC transporter permease [Gemmatimonadaceae bacterium]